MKVHRPSDAIDPEPEVFRGHETIAHTMEELGTIGVRLPK